ncbi:hypothetical protein XANCAGTX0491_004587 [Xanthoria calcicola]
MSHLKTREEVWLEIEKLGKAVKLVDPDIRKYKAWFKDQIEQRRGLYPCMADAQYGDYLDWAMEEMTRAVREAKAVPKPTSQEFWKAAYDYDPLGPNPPPNGSELQRIITSGRMEPISIGRIYGEVLLKLLPVIGALPAPEIPDFEAPFDFAATDSAAISYPDGHPSEEDLAPQWESLPGGGMGRSRKPPTIKAAEDDKLRRFAALGWVLQEAPDGRWTKTGHVLVIDMDDRDVRHRHPWLVLAKEWPTDGIYAGAGGFTMHAEDIVGRNDRKAPGVFPGDKNRTPICRIMPMNKKAGTNVPVLQRLGDNFNFVPERLGGHRPARRSRNGPGLAKVMEWYWDPVAEQEVCYTSHGLEYMRYDRKSKAYSFPDFARLSFAGEQGLFGEIEAPAQEAPREPYGRPVSLAERMARSTIGGPGPSTRQAVQTHSREQSSTMGF